MTDNHPALDHRSLCELTDVMRYVPGYQPEPSVDETLLHLIDSVSVDTYNTIGREFTPRLDTPQARLFELDSWEVDERTACIGDLSTVDGNTLVEILLEDGTLDQTLLAGAYVALPRYRDAWEPVTELEFPRLCQAPATPAILRVRQQLQITGTWGFPIIPKNVVESVAKLVVVRYMTDIPNPSTAFTDAVGNINIAGMFKSANEALESWRLPTIG